MGRILTIFLSCLVFLHSCCSTTEGNSIDRVRLIGSKNHRCPMQNVKVVTNSPKRFILDICGEYWIYNKQASKFRRYRRSETAKKRSTSSRQVKKQRPHKSKAQSNKINRPNKDRNIDRDVSLSGDTVRKVVGKSSGLFKRCYEEELRKDPTVGGRITVRFTVGKDGRVISSSLSEYDLPEEPSLCILNVIQNMRFPPTKNGKSVTFSFPFLFEPSQKQKKSP